MPSAAEPDPLDRAVQYSFAPQFPDILRQIGGSLLLSTGAAGQLLVLAPNESGLTLTAHNFDSPTGIAVRPGRIAVGGSSQVYMLRGAPALALQSGDSMRHDACFLTRTVHVTGEVAIGDMQWCGDELWFVSTLFSCLATLDDEFSFVPRWRPPFVSELAPEDRCHLSGFCEHGGWPRYVTVSAATDGPSAWRSADRGSGCVMDVATGRTVAGGLLMPHSPRIHRGRTWVLDSARGQLAIVETSSGTVTRVSRHPGFARGLDFADEFAFVGLSRLPLTPSTGPSVGRTEEESRCAVVVVDTTTGTGIAHVEFMSGVDEIFDVRVLRGITCPLIHGPLARQEGTPAVWYLPPEQAAPGRDGTAAEQPAAPADGVGASRRQAQGALEARQHVQQGLEFAESSDFESAVECFQRAVASDPDWAAAHAHLGLALQFQKQIKGSIAHLKHSLTLDPNEPSTHVNLFASLFLDGRIQRAWHEYEWRWKCDRFGRPPAALIQRVPVWDGASLAGRCVVVYGEQGIGDEIMFASCLPELIEEAGRCIVLCQDRLVPLFQRSFPSAEVLPDSCLNGRGEVQQLSTADYQVAAGSVPRFLRNCRGSFPKQRRYLLADGAHVTRWHQWLDTLGSGRKIGISWRGGADAVERQRRSASLAEWSEMLTLPETEIINLQYGDTVAEVSRLPNRQRRRVHQPPAIDPLQDMDCFAALVDTLDAVVSVDNSTVHLAGALGVPTIALVTFPSASYWRWFLDRADTVWYRSVRLVRRTFPEPWQATMGKAIEMLRDG